MLAFDIAQGTVSAMASSAIQIPGSTTADKDKMGSFAPQLAISEWLTAEQLAACPDDFLCPINFEIMMEPVILLKTGQRYDSSSLRKWFEAGGVQKLCI